MNATPRAIELARSIRLVLLDVDGVFTDGKLYYAAGPDGSMVETKAFDSQDGIGIRLAHHGGLQTGIISGRNSPAVQDRARDLGITHIYQGVLKKIPAYEEIRSKAGVEPREVAFVGDDLTDLAVMRLIGLPIAVQNARPEVKEFAAYTTISQGGSGAVREVIEFLLKAQGKWEEVVSSAPFLR